MAEHFVEEEVQGFFIEGSWYYVVLQSGRVLNILHSSLIQPDIYNADDYYTYLLIEAKEGFYLFRQRIVKNVASGWILERQMDREDAPSFELCCRQLSEKLAQANYLPPL